MKKKLLFIVLLLVSVGISRAQYSTVAPTGQTIYYLVSGGHASIWYPGSLSSPWGGYAKPTDSLAIPATITHEGQTYPVTSIIANAFTNCSGLTAVALPESVNYIGAYAFLGCRQLRRINIPEGVAELNGCTFQECVNLTEINIPNTVTRIGYKDFYYCRSLASIVIPNSVTRIDSAAFNYSGLVNIEIGSGVYRIGDHAFAACNNLASLRMRCYPPEIQSHTFAYTPTNRPVYIPCGTRNAYESHWSQFSYFIEEPQYSFLVETADSAKGIVHVIKEPTCADPSAEIMAMSKQGYRFTHWQDGDTVNPRSIVVYSDTTFTAYFENGTEGIETVQKNYKLTVVGNVIRISGAMGETVRVFDVVGRQLLIKKLDSEEIRLDQMGVFFVQIGNAPAEKVVLVR